MNGLTETVIAGSTYCILAGVGFPSNTIISFAQTSPAPGGNLGSATSNNSGGVSLLMTGMCPTSVVVYTASGGGCFVVYTNAIAPIKVNSLQLKKQNGINQVSFITENEKVGTIYELLKSANGKEFTTTGITVTATTTMDGTVRTLTDVAITTTTYYKVLVREISNTTYFTNILKTTTQLIESTIYPNPVKNTATLTVPNNLLNGRYTITNINGQVAASGKVLAQVQQIDFTKLTKGIYFIKVSNNTEVVNLKISKQ